MITALQRDAIVAVVLASAVFAVFSPTVTGRFLNWDDDRNVVYCPPVRSLDRGFVAWSFTNYRVGDFKPLTWFSYAFDYRFWGLNPVGYRLGNLLLHAAAALAVYRLFRTAASPPIPPAAACLGALFWAVHPLRLESVAWISDRKGLLCGFFYLLALLSWLGNRRLRPGWYRRTLLFTVLALLSKPVAATIRVALAALELLPGRRLSPRRLAAGLAPLAALAAVTGLLALYGQSRGGALAGWGSAGLGSRLIWGAEGIVLYPYLLIFPWRISSSFPIPPIEGAALIAAAALFSGLLVFAFRLHGKNPAPLAWLVFYLGAIFPFCGIFPTGLVTAAARYAYVPGVALAGFAATVFLGRHPRRGAVAAAGTAVAVLGIYTFLSGFYWRDSLALWSRAARVSPGSLPARAHYGEVLYERGCPEPASRELYRALELFRETPLPAPGVGLAVITNLSQALMRMERYSQAEAVLAPAVRESPGWLLHSLYASLSRRQGRIEPARRHYRLALAGNPLWIPALCELGLMEAQSGDPAAAARYYRRALLLSPRSPRARYYLALLRLDQGDPASAQAILEPLRREYPSSQWLARAAAAAAAAGNGAPPLFEPPPPGFPKEPDIPFFAPGEQGAGAIALAP